MSITDARLTQSGGLRGLQAGAVRVMQDYEPEVVTPTGLWKGVGLVADALGHNAADLALLDASWYYDWTYDWGDAYHEDTPGVQYVPMMWGDWVNEARWDLGGPPSEAIGDSEILLGFNEPDLAAQSNLTVARALALWPQLEATGARLGSPVVSGGSGLSGWLPEFMAADPRVDFICAHWYGTAAGASALGTYLDNLHTMYGLPIWLTEVCNLYDGGSANAALVPVVMNLLSTRPWVERVAWFTVRNNAGWPGTELVNDNGTLSVVGTVYASYPPGGEEPVPVTFTDDFERADGPLGANWQSLGYGSHPMPVIVSGSPRWPGEAGAAYTAHVLETSGNMYMELEIHSFPSNTGIEAWCRADTAGGASGYLTYIGSFGVEIGRMTSGGSYVTLSASGGVSIPATPFTLRLEHEVTGALRMYLNDTLVRNATDTTFSANTLVAFGIYEEVPSAGIPRIEAVEGGLLEPFTPADLPNLVGWWDASDAASFTYSSGSVVSQWRDKSATGKHLNVSSGGATRTGTQNGLSTVVFDGDDDLQTATFTSIPQPVSVHVVVKTVTHGSGSRAFFYGEEGGDGVALWYNMGLAEYRFQAGGSIFGATGMGGGGWHIVGGVFNGASSTQRIDGAQVGTTNTGTLGIGTSIEVGSFDDTSWFAGEIAEIVVCSTALTSTDLTNLETYLMDKWGL